MPRVVHVVITDNFAGAERYVCNVANETASRGWAVTVVGGRRSQMEVALDDVRWLPGGGIGRAVGSLMRAGRQDICHAHMTRAEAAGLATRFAHQAPVVATRHFAAERGATTAGRLLAPWIASGLAREIAISGFVAENVERRPDAVVLNGVPETPLLWRADSRVVLVMQRLEREKDTLTALRAWRQSELSNEGWALRVVGTGAERSELEAWVTKNELEGVTFVGWTSQVAEEFARAGMFLAPAHAEPFGLGVLEAMAAGVPVVAARGGGHLETIGLTGHQRLFRPGDADGAAAALRSLVAPEARAEASAKGRTLVGSTFTIGRHVDLLLVEYAAARTRGRSRHRKAHD